MRTSRWSAEEATAWTRRWPWPCGFNYLPSTAVNMVEMWHHETFDPVTIERELSWAAGIGFSAARINLPALVWAHDREGLLQRFGDVLAIADGLGIAVMPCLLDDCGFGGAAAGYGRQLDPVAGVHNSRAVASPGRDIVMDRSAWPQVEAYVRDVVDTMRDDARIMVWDLYNEPGNRTLFTADGAAEYDERLPEHSLALMEECFGWARDVDPVQPLTVGAWSASDDAPAFGTAVDRRALELSDVITFHAYVSASTVSEILSDLARLGRPVACTEWMARAAGSRISEQLPLFADARAGCFQWGLVQGRSQTHLAWPDPLGPAAAAADGAAWFHDLIHRDGRPYDEDEIAAISRVRAGDLEPWSEPPPPTSPDPDKTR